MTDQILKTLLEKYNIKNYKLDYREIPYEDFGKVHDFSNSFYIVEKICLYGKTTLNDINTKKFVTPVINNVPKDLTPTIQLTNLFRVGSDRYIQVCSEELLIGDTKLTFNTENLLFTEVYKGFARVLEIIPTK